jgi:hypothetical protein
MPFDFSLVSAPFRMQPGLRRVVLGTEQLTPTRPGSKYLREKIAVLSRFAGQALVNVPGFDASPALATVAREAASMSPVAFEFDSLVDCEAPTLGWAIREGRVEGDGGACIGELLEALPSSQRSAALLCLAFEQDFAVIDGATATLPWLAVCLPSRWAPESKVGRHFAEVHAPVADSTILLAASDQLARLVTGSERWERFVWTISADPGLDQHPGRGDARWPDLDGAEDIAAIASWRSERQTFIPVPGTTQAVFTIHVESVPLASAITSCDDAMRVHAALRSMTPAVLAYRGLDTVRDLLLDWLAKRAMRLPGPVHTTGRLA